MNGRNRHCAAGRRVVGQDVTCDGRRGVCHDRRSVVSDSDCQEAVPLLDRKDSGIDLADVGLQIPVTAEVGGAGRVG